MGTYVQYGCGLCAPKEWVNFDVSPTLKMQKLPLVGSLIASNMSVKFPRNVRYGNIVKGLPLADNSADGVYCSHVLEHLPYEGFRQALVNTYRILKPGGLFRLVMPDFENLINAYVEQRTAGDREASIKFMRASGMALISQPTGMMGRLKSAFGNSRHQWLWDHRATILELEKVGFTSIRTCEFHDSQDEMFKLVEEKERFWHAVALEMSK